MQGLFGGFSRVGVIHIDSSKTPYSSQYKESDWNSVQCQIGCLDFENRDNKVIEHERYVVAFFGYALGLVDDELNTMEEYVVENSSDLIELISDRGEKALLCLNGSFIAAIFDKASQELRIYNDRFGIYPLFYTTKEDGSFYFAQDALLLKQVMQFDPDYIGISEYLSFDYCLEDRTLFKNVSYILPAQKIVVGMDGIYKETYWELPRCHGIKTKSKKEYLKELNTLYRDAIMKRKSSVANIIGLSGGFDSRLILAVLDGKNVFSYNHGSRGSGDVVGARALADVYATNHHYLDFADVDYNKIAKEIVIRTGGQMHHEEFYQLASAYEKRKIADAIEIAGIGGDAVSGQKSNFTGLVPIMSAKMTPKRKVRQRKRILHDITRGRQPAYDSKYYGPIISSSWDKVKEDYNKAVDEAEKGFTFGNYSMRLKMRSIERRITMPSMAVTDQILPVRLPIYDYRIINFFNSIPQTYRFGQRLYIRLIQDYYPKAASCPHSETGKAIKESHCVMTDFVTIKNFIRGKIGLNKTRYTNIFHFADEAMLNNPSINDIVANQPPVDSGIFNLDEYGSVDGLIDKAKTGDNSAIKLLKNIIQFSLLNESFYDGKLSLYYKP
ncbi:asparagine synthase-related protein [Butyrivibrio sp. CB08]|uniref:asparagine synthase-related protein n=1 Tax=Butyrivibrio sp. CB08 TaxID=2364879 RepID=UPI001314CB4E|nr:asparagine synthetase B family protein [Butyrivibrio sp. CB08]